VQFVAGMEDIFSATTPFLCVLAVPRANHLGADTCSAARVAQ
jgi:hypothetical protein